MSYVIKGYKNSQNTVRQVALELITSVYRYASDKVRTYYQDLRPAQINIIGEALANGLDYYDECNMDGNEIVNNSQMLIQEQQNSERNNKMMMISSFANKNINDDILFNIVDYLILILLVEKLRFIN